MEIVIKIIYQILIASNTLDNRSLNLQHGETRIKTERDSIHIIMQYYYKFSVTTNKIT